MRAENKLFNALTENSEVHTFKEHALMWRKCLDCISPVFLSGFCASLCCFSFRVNPLLKCSFERSKLLLNTTELMLLLVVVMVAGGVCVCARARLFVCLSRVYFFSL